MRLNRRCLLTLPLLAALPARAKPVMAAQPLSRADLPWWRDRHQAKLLELRQKQPALIFLGDSITQQWEQAGPPAWLDYAPAWKRFYGDRNAVNLGYKGDATSHLLWRVQNGEAAGIHPKLAVVLIGANNMGRLRWPAEDTVAGIEAILNELKRRLPATKILLLGVLPSERGDWVQATTQTINTALAARYHGSLGITFLDVGHVFMRNGHVNRDLFSDPKMNPPEPTLHPSAQGQIRLSEAIEPTLAALLGDRPHK